MKEFALLAQQIIIAPIMYDETAVAKFLSKEAVSILETYGEALHVKGALASALEFETFTKEFLEQKGLKLKDLAQSIRIAMVGSSVSPAIFDVLEIIGYNEVLKRIQNLLSKQKES